LISGNSLPGDGIQGYLAHKETPTPSGILQDYRHRPTVGSYGEGFLASEVRLYGLGPRRFRARRRKFETQIRTLVGKPKKAKDGIWA